MCPLDSTRAGAIQDESSLNVPHPTSHPGAPRPTAATSADPAPAAPSPTRPVGAPSGVLGELSIGSTAGRTSSRSRAPGERPTPSAAGPARSISVRQQREHAHRHGNPVQRRREPDELVSHPERQPTRSGSPGRRAASCSRSTNPRAIAAARDPARHGRPGTSQASSSGAHGSTGRDTAENGGGDAPRAPWPPSRTDPGRGQRCPRPRGERRHPRKIPAHPRHPRVVPATLKAARRA
jgi:hypothetical protein